jgi:tetratricopeptide (TPR) repeat protein
MRRLLIAPILALLWISSSAAAPAPESAPAQVTPQESALAQGLRLVEQKDMAGAVPALEQALATPGLPPQLHLIALRAATMANSAAAENATKDLKDTYNAQALKWARQWAALEPDIASPRKTIAKKLWDLGGYDAAKAEFDGIYKRWPAEMHWAAINMSMIDRILGRYNDALVDLNRYDLQANGTLRSMPFHFHRADVYLMMGRYLDVIQDIDLGLVAQPAYGWAYVRKACAEAHLGRFTQAAADQRFAMELMKGMPAPPEYAEEARTQIAFVDDGLSAYVAAAKGAAWAYKGQMGCGHPGGDDYTPRAPSPLLNVK